MARLRSLGPLVLILAGTAAGLLVIEAVLRARAFLEYRGTLTAERALPPDPLPGTTVTLGQMIRRSPHRRIVYELRPDLQVVYSGAPVSTNARGFRGADPGPDKPKGLFRIVGLGDSFMFGQGVSDEETHLFRLVRRLNEGRAAPAWDAVNLAVPGYNTAMEVEVLKEKGLAYRPDLVLLEFIGNDVELPNFIVADPEVLSLRRSFLARFVAGRLRPRPRPQPSEDAELAPTDPEVVPPAYRDLVGWPAVEAACRELHDLGLQHGFRVAVLRWEGIRAEKRLVRLAGQLGFPTLDLSPVMDAWVREHGYPSWALSPLVLSATDNHPSVLGHQLVSEAVLRFLRDEGLLPPDALP